MKTLIASFFLVLSSCSCGQMPLQQNVAPSTKAIASQMHCNTQDPVYTQIGYTVYVDGTSDVFDTVNGTQTAQYQLVDGSPRLYVKGHIRLEEIKGGWVLYLDSGTVTLECVSNL